MIKQTIHIIDFKILYNILDEIKNYFKFQILHYKNEENFLNSNDLILLPCFLIQTGSMRPC